MSLFPASTLNHKREIRCLLRAVGGIVIVCLAILFALFVHFFPWATHVHVIGVVIDGTTNKPVPNARLIVTLRRNGFPFDGMIAKYGLVTDADGRFSLDREAPRRFHDFWVEASSPTNQYGILHLSGRSEDVVIRVGPLPASIADMAHMRYERFAGGAPYLGIKEVEFINESWHSMEP